MATVHGIAVNKSNDKFVWKLGIHLWEFRQWPREGMWRNGCKMTSALVHNNIKTTDEAVIFTMGFEAGQRWLLQEAAEKALQAFEEAS